MSLSRLNNKQIQSVGFQMAPYGTTDSGLAVRVLDVRGADVPDRSVIVDRQFVLVESATA